MTETADYKIELDVFEGPLDLLLYLIKKDEIDIYDIPIEVITTQYMEYLNLMRMLDLNIAGEFIVMAATLMLIKSRMLLPADVIAGGDEEEEEEADPRWDLVRQLVEYKKFKDAANRLQHLEELQENIFGPGLRRIQVEADDPGVALEDVSLFDLIAAFNDVLKRTAEEQIGEIFDEHLTVADRIDVILKMVARKRQVVFSSLFSDASSRHEVITTFLALLELIRLRQISAVQPEPFSEIMIGIADEVTEDSDGE